MKKWILSLVVECFLEKDTSGKIRVPRNDPIKNPNADALSLDHGTLGYNTYTSSIKLEHPSKAPDHLLPLKVYIYSYYIVIMFFLNFREPFNFFQ